MAAPVEAVWLEPVADELEWVETVVEDTAALDVDEIVDRELVAPLVPAAVEIADVLLAVELERSRSPGWRC